MTPEEQVLLGPGATPVSPYTQYQAPTSSTLNYTPYINYTPVNPNYTQGVVSTYKPTSGQVLSDTTDSSLNYSPSPYPITKDQNTTQTQQTTVNKDNLLSKFPGYTGWNLDSAWQDYLATGGSGKGGSTSTGWTSPEGQTYGSQEEYNRLIDEAYNPQMNALNQQETNLGLGQTSALQEAQSAYETQTGMVGGQKESALGVLEQMKNKGQQSYESALSQARDLYDQLKRGYQQRFGGSSSAGQAATEIANRERMKQQGENYRSLQDVFQKVSLAKADVENQFSQNMLQLKQNLTTAVNSIKADFRDKLAQITSSKGMVESAKAQAKLQALQNLRAQVLQVQQQETQFKQQLELQKQQSNIQLDTYAKQLAMTQGQTGTNTQGSFQQLAKTPTSNLQVQSNVLNPMGPLSLSGMISGQQRKYDQYGNPIL